MIDFIIIAIIAFNRWLMQQNLFVCWRIYLRRIFNKIVCIAFLFDFIFKKMNLCKHKSMLTFSFDLKKMQKHGEYQLI